MRVTGKIAWTVLSCAIALSLGVAAGCSTQEDQAATPSTETSANDVEGASADDDEGTQVYTTAEEALASAMDSSWSFAVDEEESTEGDIAYLTGPEKNRWLETVWVKRDDSGSWSVYMTGEARGPDWEESRWAAGWDDPTAYDDGPTSAPLEFVRDYLRCIDSREFELAGKRLTDPYAASGPSELSPGENYLEPFGYELVWSRESGDVVLVDTEETWSSGTQLNTYTVIRAGANWRIDGRTAR